MIIRKDPHLGPYGLDAIRDDELWPDTGVIRPMFQILPNSTLSGGHVFRKDPACETCWLKDNFVSTTHYKNPYFDHDFKPMETPRYY